jgi:flagellar biosynthesis/type III secretory pathway M-ring protein FliF/YscJ
VLVSLEPGSSLSPEQVQAVVHLVASSIEGLSPDQVTVVDQNGDVLNAPGSDSGNVAAGTLEQQQTEAYEQSLDDSLQDMLATVLGPGNAVVHTNAELDFDQTSITSQIYNPNNQAPIPVQQATSKESYAGSSAVAAAEGVMGATTVPVSSGASAASASNPTPVTTTTTPATTTTTSRTAARTASAKKTGSAKTASATVAAANKTAKSTKSAKGGTTTTTPGATTTTAAAGAGAGATTTVPDSYTQEGSSQQNVVSEVTKSVDSAPGALVRLSVAVVVDSSVKDVNATEVKQLISAAAGLQASRGDSIQVAFVPFDQTAAKEAAAQLKTQAAAKSQSALMGEARDGAVVLFVIGLFLFAMRRITKTTRVPLALPAGYQPLELEAAEEFDEEATMALPPARDAQPAVPSIPLQQEVNQLGQMIEREPERIAAMLRTWLETGPTER